MGLPQDLEILSGPATNLVFQQDLKNLLHVLFHQDLENLLPGRPLMKFFLPKVAQETRFFLTIHPGICAEVPDAGGRLGRVGYGITGGPGREVDIDRDGRAGQDQEPEDGQDIGDAHELKGGRRNKSQ